MWGFFGDRPMPRPVFYTVNRTLRFDVVAGGDDSAELLFVQAALDPHSEFELDKIMLVPRDNEEPDKFCELSLIDLSSMRVHLGPIPVFGCLTWFYVAVPIRMFGIWRLAISGDKQRRFTVYLDGSAKICADNL